MVCARPFSQLACQLVSVLRQSTSASAISGLFAWEHRWKKASPGNSPAPEPSLAVLSESRQKRRHASRRTQDGGTCELAFEVACSSQPAITGLPCIKDRHAKRVRHVKASGGCGRREAHVRPAWHGLCAEVPMTTPKALPQIATAVAHPHFGRIGGEEAMACLVL